MDSRAATDASIRRPTVAALLKPSLFDLFLLTIPAWLFMSGSGGWSRLLMDGDTGWHIVTGRWILAHRDVPRTDLFSFTLPGEPWFAWEWLSDLIFAGLDARFGLPGVLVFSALLVTLCAGVLLRRTLAAGVNPLLALPLTLLGIGVCTAHLLARPHLFSFVLFPLGLALVESDLNAPSRRLWLLVPLTAIWVNLHGAWAGFVLSLLVLSAGFALESFLFRRPWIHARRFATVAGACVAASFVNPYGWRLHAHLASYLTSDWIRQSVNEFQSPRFRSEPMAHFEILLFAGLAAAALLVVRRQLAWPLLLICWAHLSLTSARHAPLFALLACPAIGVALTQVARDLFADARFDALRAGLTGIGRDYAPPLKRGGLAAVSTLVALSWLPSSIPKSFPADLFPVALAISHGTALAESRLLTTDEWADYLLYANYPRQRVFFDGRSDFYGESLGREYLDLLNAAPDWRQRLDKYQIDTVLLPPGTPLATVLSDDAQWILEHKTGKSLLFRRVGKKNSTISLNFSPKNADRYSGERSRE